MISLVNWLRTRLSLMREEGQGLAEYALILVLVAIAAIVALTALGGGISGIFETITGALGGE